MLGLKLIHVCKRVPWSHNPRDRKNTKNLFKCTRAITQWSWLLTHIESLNYSAYTILPQLLYAVNVYTNKCCFDLVISTGFNLFPPRHNGGKITNDNWSCTFLNEKLTIFIFQLSRNIAMGNNMILFVVCMNTLLDNWNVGTDITFCNYGTSACMTSK